MNQEIENLRQQQETIHRRIQQIIAQCPHHNTRKTTASYFNGPAFYEHCLDCGKQLKAHWPYNPDIDGPVDDQLELNNNASPPY